MIDLVRSFLMPTNNPAGENQQTQKDDRKGQLGGGQGGSGKQGGASHGGTSGKDNPGNFANDREKASEAGRKGGQHS
jgi:general stress protein YciG